MLPTTELLVTSFTQSRQSMVSLIFSSPQTQIIEFLPP